MEFKKLIIKGLLFFITTFLVYVFFIFLLVEIEVKNKSIVYCTSETIRKKGGNTYRKFIDFNKEHPYDIIVIGSSHAYRGYDPRIFKKNDIDLFNLGTSGQSLLNSYYIVENYLISNNCKLAVLDIYDGALSGDGMESTSDLMQNINSDIAAFKMGLALKDPRSINMFTVRLFNKTKPAMYIDSSYVINGYSEKNDSIKFDSEMGKSPDLKINETQIYYLRKTLSCLADRNIKTLLVTHPAPKEIERLNHMKFSAAVKDIALEFQIQYWDYSFSHDLNSKYNFYDSHHLNQSGVEKFNKVFINDLRSKGYLNNF